MREENFRWVVERMAAICAKYSYDRDMVERQFSIIDSDLGVPAVRQTLSSLVKDHHYELAAFFAECLLKDRRSSYRALGSSYAKKCAKAPKESPHLLRLRDRANDGLSCFVAKFSVSNPWMKDSVSPAKCLRIFAATKEKAAEHAQHHASSLIPGGETVNLRVVNILDDPEAEMAEVTRVQMTCEAADVLGTAEATSFSGANEVLQAWRVQFTPRHPLAAVKIKVEWENGVSYSFIDTLARVARRAAINLAGVIEQDIAFVFGEFVYPDKSEREQALLYERLVGMGAKEHCAYIRATCLLRDSRAARYGLG